MNPTGPRYAKCFSIAMLTGAFLLSSSMPLLASPPQSSQSSSSQSSTSQKPEDSLPDAPQAQSGQQPTSQQSQSQQPASVPSGAAAAKAADVKGAPVAQPSGAAVAPPRQRGHRSLVLKLGLLAGAGIAVGSAVALSKGSPSRPPGAAATPAHP